MVTEKGLYQDKDGFKIKMEQMAVITLLFWTKCHHPEGLVDLRSFIENSMTHHSFFGRLFKIVFKKKYFKHFFGLYLELNIQAQMIMMELL